MAAPFPTHWCAPDCHMDDDHRSIGAFRLPIYTLEVVGDTSLRGKTIWLSTALTALQYHARG